MPQTLPILGKWHISLASSRDYLFIHWAVAEENLCIIEPYDYNVAWRGVAVESTGILWYGEDYTGSHLGSRS